MVLCIPGFFSSSWKFCQLSSFTSMWNFLKALASLFYNHKLIVQGKFLKLFFNLCIFFHFKEASLKFFDSIHYYIYCHLRSYLLWNSVGVTFFDELYLWNSELNMQVVGYEDKTCTVFTREKMQLACSRTCSGLFKRSTVIFYIFLKVWMKRICCFLSR